VPDPYRKLQYGQVIDFRTVTWNAMLEAALAQKGRQHDRRVPERPSFRQADIIHVKNESDRDVSRGHVLGLDRPIFLPSDSEDAFLREVTFRGVVPAAEHRGRFCVALDPMAAGRIGRAYVSGVCPARVEAQGPYDQFADIIPDETEALGSGDSGAAQILWMESETDPYGHGYAYDGLGEWAIVRIGAGSDGAAYGTTTSAVGPSAGTSLGTGTATLTGQVGAQAVHNWFSVPIPDATKIVVVRANSRWVITGADCDL
jgi:hypothetical protein